MNSPPRVGVVLLNWNNEDNVLTHIRNLTHWNTPPSLIVVDNASDRDISSLIADTYPEVTVLNSKVNRGFSGGNNLGFTYCLENSFEYIFLLNHDANISEEIVRTLLDVMENKPEIGVIGPRTYEDETWYAGGRSIAQYPATRIPFNPSGPVIRTVDYIPGAACMIRGTALKKAGLFDEQFFFSGEMADLCQRIKNAGYTCAVDTRVGITHNTGDNSPMRERIHLYYSLRNRFLYIRKNEKHAVFWTFFWLFYALFLPMGVLIRGKPHSARAGILAVRDGLLGRFGDHNEYFIH